MTAPPSPPAGWYPDPKGLPGQKYWDGEAWHSAPEPPSQSSGAAIRPPARHRTAWFVLGGLSLVASAFLLLDHFTVDSRYCDYSPGQLCEEVAPLFNSLSVVAMLLIIVVVIVAVTLALRWGESIVRTALFVVATLVVPVLLLVPGTPLHPRVNFGNSSTTVLPSPAASAGGGSSSESPGGSEGSSPGQAKITVNGELQDLSGPVKCDDLGAGEQIYIGGDGGTLIQMLQTDPPKVENLNFGASTSYDGVSGLEVDTGNDSTNVTATKDGNSWKFEGTAAGQKDHSSQFVTRTFEIDLTCP